MAFRLDPIRGMAVAIETAAVPMRLVETADVDRFHEYG
jgi:hypothetical protein